MAPSNRTEATLRDYKNRIGRALAHIQRQLDSPLPLDELATVACFSPFHFHRVFKGMIGESVGEHIRRLRLERAACQLRAGLLPITQIALNAGYEAHAAFTRAFKDYYGVAPSRFRRQVWRHADLVAPSGVHYRPGRATVSFKMPSTKPTKMNITIKTIQPIRVAALRHLGPYSEVGTTWERLVHQLEQSGFTSWDTRYIGISYDDPDQTPPTQIRYDACVEVDESFAARGDLTIQTIPGGEHAVAVHRGPYRRIGDSYATLMGCWLPRSGRHLNGLPCFQIGLNDPKNTPPEDLLTEIYLPLEPL
jgi:AraC family transcriptional regulator